MGILLFPQDTFCFWDEDSLKQSLIITGITIGSILALGILVVLVAGTIDTLKRGEDSDYFSEKSLDAIKYHANKEQFQRTRAPYELFHVSNRPPEKPSTHKTNDYRILIQPKNLQDPRLYSYRSENPRLIRPINKFATYPRLLEDPEKNIPLTVSAAHFLLKNSYIDIDPILTISSISR
jgi:hypothetical protein